MITIKTAQNIAEEELKKAQTKGYKIAKIASNTTNSLYYTVSDGQDKISFRISDHPTFRNSIMTLDIRYHTTPDKIRQFVKNRVAGVGKRKLRSVLG